MPVLDAPASAATNDVETGRASDEVRPILTGHKSLIVGIANDQSIAYGCAAASAPQAQTLRSRG
jgi:hypothetical protein